MVDVEDDESDVWRGELPGRRQEKRGLDEGRGGSGAKDTSTMLML